MDEIVTSSDAGCEVSSDSNQELKTRGMRVDKRSHFNVFDIFKP